MPDLAQVEPELRQGGITLVAGPEVDRHEDLTRRSGGPDLANEIFRIVGSRTSKEILSGSEGEESERHHHAGHNTASHHQRLWSEKPRLDTRLGRFGNSPLGTHSRRLRGYDCQTFNGTPRPLICRQPIAGSLRVC